MNKFPKECILELLLLAETQAPHDPESAIAAHLFRSLLEPEKPRDLLREALRDKMSDYTLAMFDEDANNVAQLANDIRRLLASHGLLPTSIH